MMAQGEGSGDDQVVVEVDSEIEIVPPGVLTRSMMSMARHPGGEIFLNTQTGPLYKSADEGQTWTAVPVEMPDVPAGQVLHGLGVSRDGRLWLVHQSPGPWENDLYGQDLFVSYSADRGRTWTRSKTDFGKFPPGIPNMQFHEDGNRTVVEQADGTLMFTTSIVPSPAYREKYPASGNSRWPGRPGDLFSDVIFRSTDGGETWGDPTQVYPPLSPHESNLALDPNDSDHMLLMSRCQGELLPDQDPDEFMKKTGNPQPYIKQGVLFESSDGGRTFHDVGWTNYYGHRATVYWAPSNVVIVTGCAGMGGCFIPTCPYGSGLVARISLDGGKTWVDDTKTGAPDMTRAKKFELIPKPPGHSFTTPTVELSTNRFLTTYGYYWGHAQKVTVNGFVWHIETPGQ
jgi:hypothetical protein